MGQAIFFVFRLKTMNSTLNSNFSFYIIHKRFYSAEIQIYVILNIASIIIGVLGRKKLNLYEI